MQISTGRATGLAGYLWAMMGALALAFALLPAVPAAAQDDGVTPARVAGENRVETAARIATLTYGQADVAHLVFGGKFPDALAASYGAGVVDGPILLAAARDDVGSPTWEALEQLGVQEVRLVGGPGVLDPAVEQQLGERGYGTVRIAGDDRYATAAEVAVAYGLSPGDPVGTVEGQRAAVMATGATFPDALAVGPISAAANLPLVLTPPHRSDAATEDALVKLDIERIQLIGGPGAVSEAVEQHYRNLGYTVERQAGPNRMDTAALLADLAKHDFGFSHDLVLLARGDDFPDALAASVHGAAAGAPILLTRTPHDLSETADWLARTCPDVDAIRALGGPGAVSPETLDAAIDAAEACIDEREPHTRQSYIQSPQEVQTAQAGHTFDITVSGFREQSNPAPVNIALFPCDVADPADPNRDTFRDADDDGHADGIATTTNGHAVISSLHDDATSTTHLADVHPDPANQQIRYSVHSDARDCVIPVVFHDANDNDQLDVDAQGHALEHWNWTELAWQ